MSQQNPPQGRPPQQGGSGNGRQGPGHPAPNGDGGQHAPGRWPQHGQQPYPQQHGGGHQQPGMPPQPGQPPAGFPNQPPQPGGGARPGSAPQQYQGGPPPHPGQQHPGQQGPGQHHPGQQGAPQQPLATSLADGDWHQMHKLTPWLNFGGGIIASFFILFWILVSLIGSIFDNELDFPLGAVLGLAALGFVILVALIGVIVFLDFKNRQFRLTSEVFELRSGVIGKNNRQVRLDRLQSVNLTRPLLPRLLGLTQLETSGAGKDSDIKLQYLSKDQAESLRTDVLRRASGAKKRKQHGYSAPAPGQQQVPAGAPPAPGRNAPGAAPAGHAPAPQPHRRRTLSDYIDAAVDDFSSPELAEGSVPQQAVVNVAPGRVAGATFLSMVVTAIVLFVFGLIIGLPLAIILSASIDNVSFGVVFIAAVAGALGIGVFLLIIGGIAAVSTLMSSMNYTIAGTSDGVRIGRGLLNQTNDTVPPGRIHSVQLRQPWLWRKFGWYEVRVDRADLQNSASSDSNEQSQNLRRQVILPVGTWTDAQRVLSLVLPMHMSQHTAEILTTAMKPGPQPTFIPTPSKARILHPFTSRRLGYAIDRGVIYLRKGYFDRRIAMIPGERIQSITLHDSPIQRGLGVVSLWINTVGRAVTTRLPNVDAATSTQLFDQLESLAIARAAADTSHRWSEAAARTALATAHMVAQDAQASGQRVDPYTMRVLEAEAAWQREQGGQDAQGHGQAPTGATGSGGSGQRPGSQGSGPQGADPQGSGSRGPDSYGPGAQGPGPQSAGPHGSGPQGHGSAQPFGGPAGGQPGGWQPPASPPAPAARPAQPPYPPQPGREDAAGSQPRPAQQPAPDSPRRQGAQDGPAQQPAPGAPGSAFDGSGRPDRGAPGQGAPYGQPPCPSETPHPGDPSREGRPPQQGAAPQYGTAPQHDRAPQPSRPPYAPQQPPQPGADQAPRSAQPQGEPRPEAAPEPPLRRDRRRGPGAGQGPEAGASDRPATPPQPSGYTPVPPSAPQYPPQAPAGSQPDQQPPVTRPRDERPSPQYPPQAPVGPQPDAQRPVAEPRDEQPSPQYPPQAPGSSQPEPQHPAGQAPDERRSSGHDEEGAEPSAPDAPRETGGDELPPLPPLPPHGPAR
ncbi:PH domain-containing protein [Gulosibacter sp. 10]|uniref:PH domain-containing protein n=1 Tax=Gulosibacter sp. 10 TaxID=1255570 RepID=UPI00097F176A|nr:PH domain-containing protein [Gulosibacter sp. 10]SJM59837.1 CRISPR-associated RAMP Cmr1 [Gulosibacter sp. 10]